MQMAVRLSRTRTNISERRKDHLTKFNACRVSTGRLGGLYPRGLDGHVLEGSFRFSSPPLFPITSPALSSGLHAYSGSTTSGMQPPYHLWHYTARMWQSP